MPEAIHVDYSEFVAHYIAVKKDNQWLYQPKEEQQEILYTAWVCDINDVRAVELVPYEQQ